MLIIHLSDIHFKFPECNNPDTDLDQPIRTLMLDDIAEQLNRLECKADAILLGGDIAYAGRAEEYAVAKAWIDAVDNTSGCTNDRIYTVLGNHDIDQTVRNNQSLQNALNAILKEKDDLGKLDRRFKEQLTDKAIGDLMLSPLAAYNDFAARYDCQIYAPDKLFWSRDIPLELGVTLRVRGLTSTFLSGAGAPAYKKEVKNDLMIGKNQLAIDPVGDVVNLVMCHHPPDWCLDRDAFDVLLKDRSSIHLWT